MIFNTKQKDVLKKAISTWGSHQQINKAIEEMAELIQVLAKYQNRHVAGPGFSAYGELSPIYSEMADVTIMLAQLNVIFSDGHALEDAVDAKIKKLSGYLTPPQSDRRDG